MIVIPAHQIRAVPADGESEHTIDIGENPVFLLGTGISRHLPFSGLHAKIRKVWGW